MTFSDAVEEFAPRLQDGAMIIVTVDDEWQTAFARCRSRIAGQG